MSNKRYYCDYSGENGTLIRDKEDSDDWVYHYGLCNAKDLCDLLNGQDAKIKELEHRIRELTGSD